LIQKLKQLQEKKISLTHPLNQRKEYAMRLKLYTLVAVISIVLFSPLRIDAGDTINIGVSIGLTGKYAKMADMQKKAYLLWEERTNNNGGLMDKKIKMIIEDDYSDNDTAKKIYERFIEKDRIDFVIGPYSSGLTGAIMPIAEKNGYPVIAAGAASDTLWNQGYTHLFGIFIPASRYVVGFLEMVAMKGLKDVAIVYADDPFSKSIAQGTKKWGTKFGLNISFFDEFKKGTHDLAALASGVKTANPEALIVCGHFNESVDMMVSLKKIKWRPKNYFATVGPAMPAFYQTLKNDAEMVFSASQWEPEVLYSPDDHKTFLEPFMKKYNITPSYHAAIAFASCQILETAIRKTRSLDRKKIRDVLATMDAMSIIGRYGVDDNGMQIKHFPINIQWQNGEKKVVWPEEIAKAAPIIQ
jgi:branched-chain amino acid transport system substrate-binding protein